VTVRPEAIDTSGVALEADVEALIERLAAHVHVRWMAERTRSGWTYGPTRNDDRREHPGIVPYEQLTESEKDVDRQVARSVVEALLALGCRIIPPP
jgi:hypothetical protein